MTQLNNLFLMAGALFGFLGVAAGAFGAHALKPKLSSDSLDTFEIAVRYQMYHAIVLIALFSFNRPLANSQWMTLAGGLFTGGIIVFSGSLYALVFSGIRTWGAVTPVGGLLLLLGWLSLIIVSCLHSFS